MREEGRKRDEQNLVLNRGNGRRGEEGINERNGEEKGKGEREMG